MLCGAMIIEVKREARDRVLKADEDWERALLLEFASHIPI